MSTAIKTGRRRLHFSCGALFIVGAAHVAWLGDTTTRAAEPFGIVFSGSSPEISKIKADMRQLLIAMGWTTNQVQVVDAPKGDSVSYVLSSGTPDAGTFDLAKRPELALTPETVPYVDRLGQKKTMTLASKKEILATMLGRGRRFEFSGPNGSVDQLKEHIAIRQNVVYWGFRAGWIFPEHRAYQYDTAEHWEPMLDDDWTVKSGVKPSQAIADAFVGKSSYIIGCTSACRFVFAHGIFDYFQHVKPNPSVMAGLEASLDRRRPFVGMAPKKSPDGPPPNDGLLLARHVHVPWNHWVPGDWGWIKNTDPISSDEFGSEGSNIIYAGGGIFVNYYHNHQKKNLDQLLKRVYGWRLGLEESELDLEAATMDLLRKDPRDGGMLRDVRDFSRIFH
ncbi:MAG TPA: hypothetical protein VMV69_12285 [Pirellulales bacterium]|nr:hypothetical protein [Pirellulales bacterium]